MKDLLQAIGVEGVNQHAEKTCLISVDQKATWHQSVLHNAHFKLKMLGKT